ncbi:MAG TPA: enoyl-CoA hydratase-related protein [Mycobacteriales bacterium]|nr:enoyl-CoA hydratase-related protein [Mycobacteriales bacterium]
MLRGLTGVPRVLIIAGDWTASADAGGVDADDVVARLRDTTLVSIAALAGDITGPALRLALACTLRVAAPGTALRVREVVEGTVPAPDVLAELRSVLGAAGALELAATGRALGVGEAADRGLVFAGTEADARDLAAAILAAPDDAVRATVATLRAAGAEHPASRGMLHDR